MREDGVGQFVQQTTAFDRRESAPCTTVSGLACGGHSLANVFGIAACEMREDLAVTRVEHRDGFACATRYALVVDEVGCHSITPLFALEWAPAFAGATVTLCPSA